MRKRPVCMGALFLLALLTLAGFLKPGGVSPLGISGKGYVSRARKGRGESESQGTGFRWNTALS